MIIETTRLDAQVLGRLLAGEAMAVHVRDYVPARIRHALAERLLSTLDGAGSERIYHSNVPAFSTIADDPGERASYLRRSASAMAELRALCEPHQPRTDRLRCELDEMWPGGARLLRVGGRPLVFGMMRIWRDGAEALPHLDELRRAASAALGGEEVTCQLGVNIHLRAPEAPGDGLVELWDLGHEDIDALQHDVVNGYGYRRELLPSPDAVIASAAGDLVLLRSGRLHAVRPTRRGERLTLSGFVGCSGDSRPLLLWS